MKKAILSITIVAVCFSCNNRGTGKASESDHAIEDSIKQLSLIRQQDSINRERIFDELGDTVFGKVCFGMNKTQYRKAFNEFKKP